MKSKKKSSQNPTNKKTLPDFWSTKDGGKKAPYGYWNSKENRIKATRWLIKTLGKEPDKIIQKDFISHGLVGLLVAYSDKRCATYEKGEILTFDTGYLLGHPSPLERALAEAGFILKKSKVAEKQSYGERRLGKWQSRENRVAAIKSVVEDVGDPRDVSIWDFEERRISTILNYYNKSVLAALNDAGYIIHPWERRKVPAGFWKKQKNRVAATMWLVARKDGKPRTVGYWDFVDAGLRGIMTITGGALESLNEAGYRIMPWMGVATPKWTWKLKENRVGAIKWLIVKTMKDPSNLSMKDFKSHGLKSLATGYGIHRLLTEAGYDLTPWECNRASPNTWNKKENRIAAVKWVLAKTRKEPAQLTRKDFLSRNLGSLVRGQGLYGLVTEAGYELRPWDMRVAPKGTWKSKKNRVEAVKCLVAKSRKTPSDLTKEDFIAGGLRTLVRKYETGRLLKEAGYKVKS